MARCPHCESPLSDDREWVGARCPVCHDPLYEPATRIPRIAREGEAACFVHVGSESVGLCVRCGRHLCETCRTRWRGRILCAACVDRALETSEAIPAPVLELRRQAFASLALGTTAWLVGGGALLALTRFEPATRRAGVFAAFATFLLVAGNVLLASLGAGLALAVLRAEGSYRELAVPGFVLCVLYVAIVLGLGTLGLWYL